MSKIICEVCGTAYPEMSTQCPICGCVRPADAQGVHLPEKEMVTTSGYHHVKGGRFSKSNVRKRTNGTYASAQGKSKNDAKKKSGGNTGLIITIVVLLLAIVAVVLYIALKFFVPSSRDNKTTTTADTTASIQTTEAAIACQEITLDMQEILLESEGETARLNVVVSPADTTDTVSYLSSDPLVATVTEEGLVTAVGPGEAKIMVTCGSATVQCSVYCTFAEETTEDTTAAANGFRLNRTSITFTAKGEGWVVYSGNISVNEITWTSDDESVATIVNGKVTAVGEGSTTVYAQYDGTTVSCEIICQFSDGENTGYAGNGGVSEDSGDPADSGNYRLDNLYSNYDTEVTLRTGEWFPLRLVDSNGNAVDATWSVENSSVCTVSNGDVTAVGSGSTYVIATYNGVEYRCLVRVS